MDWIWTLQNTSVILGASSLCGPLLLASMRYPIYLYNYFFLHEKEYIKYIAFPWNTSVRIHLQDKAIRKIKIAEKKGQCAVNKVEYKIAMNKVFDEIKNLQDEFAELRLNSWMVSKARKKKLIEYGFKEEMTSTRVRKMLHYINYKLFVGYCTLFCQRNTILKTIRSSDMARSHMREWVWTRPTLSPQSLLTSPPKLPILIPSKEKGEGVCAPSPPANPLPPLFKG